MTEKAANLKDEGNALFKKGQFAEAAKLYVKAEEAAPLDPIYPSNLSASQYEMGDYSGCVQSVFRSFSLIQPGSDSSLASKLSPRLAKALCLALRGSMTLEDLRGHKTAIAELEASHLSDDDAQAQESDRLWKVWRNLESTVGDRTIAAVEASLRLSSIPTIRAPPDPTLEYYSFGTDKILSILDDSPENPGATYTDQLSKLNFMFGGVGDARHVYGSIIGLHKAYQTLDNTKQAIFSSHITMIDIHPTALARDLCFFLWFQELLEADPSDKIKIAEIKATIMYTFAGVFMPLYCFTRLRETIMDLRSRLEESPPRLPSWIYVSNESIIPIQNSLTYWLNWERETNCSNTKIFSQHIHDRPSASTKKLVNDPTISISPEYRSRLVENFHAERDSIARVYLQDENLITQSSVFGFAPKNASASERKKVLEEKRDEIMDHLYTVVMDGSMLFEQNWYENTKVFVPPPALWDRHPSVQGCGMFSENFNVNVEALNEMKEEVETKWKANITLWDKEHCSNIVLQPGGLPSLTLDAFQIPHAFEEFNDRFNISESVESTEEKIAFYAIDVFIDSFVGALRTLSGCIKIEVICGNLTEQLAKIRFNGNKSRPQEFPRTYYKMWLSNVPDYIHGLFSAVVYVLPDLVCSEGAAITYNCLANTGIWRDDEEVCYNYTLLLPKDVPRFLGCRLISNEAAAHGFVTVGSRPLPVPLSELASREELVAWLNRVLIYTLFPGKPMLGAVRVRLPNNLCAFVGLLVHLQKVGFPGHWLTDFFNTILSDGVVTNIHPFTDETPYPVSDINRTGRSRKIRLDPWRVEFETILALSHQAIPLPIALPPDFTTRDSDIGTFRSEVQPDQNNMGMIFAGTAFDRTICLVFYRPDIDVKVLLPLIPGILEGTNGAEVGSIYILTVVESFDHRTEAVWKMSRERVTEMKKNDWLMIAYRTDEYFLTTLPVSAALWETIA